MKKSIVLTIVVLSLLCLVQTGHAQTPAATPAPAPATAAAAATKKAPTPAQLAQQNKMKGCAAKYHQQNIPKAQYRSFMSTCMKGTSTTEAAPTRSPTPAPMSTIAAGASPTPPAAPTK